MMTDSATGVTFRASASGRPSEYQVHHDGVMVGTVSRFVMGAGQFGASWMATTTDGQRSTPYVRRGDAAVWLVKQAGR